MSAFVIEPEHMCFRQGCVGNTCSSLMQHSSVQKPGAALQAAAAQWSCLLHFSRLCRASQHKKGTPSPDLLTGDKAPPGVQAQVVLMGAH